MRKISSAKKKALRTGLSFALTFAMALGSVPTDGIAYAAITNGAKTPQIETKVETPETPATTPVDAGIAAGTMTALTTDVTADEPKTVKVRFDANGGEGHMDDFEVTLNGGDWSVAETPFTRDGYRFVGWSVAADVTKDAVDDPETDINESLTGVVLADRQEFVDLVSQKRDEDGNVVETHDFGKYVSDDVLTLYAQWEEIVTTNEPVVDENEVVKTEESVDEVVGDDETIEDTNVVEVVDTDVTSDKALDQELLSGAFSNKTDGGVADKIGTSSPLSRKLTAPLMAAAAPSLTVQASPTGSRAGTAYAVLDSAGTLTLFRSTNTYTAGTGKTVTDVMGKTYTGQVFTGVETNTGTNYNSAPWYSKRTSVKLVKIADGQVIAPKSCAGWFYSCSKMTAFEGAERLDTSAVTSMYRMFYKCSAMTEPPAVGSWDTSKVTDMNGMNGMFRDCSAMVVPPAVGGWNTSAVTSMGSMFSGCSAMMEPPAVGGWNTSAVTNMNGMFYNCKRMAEPPAVGSWNTSKVTNMGSMFSSCSAMAEPPVVGSWNTSAVTYMGGVFSGCSAMTEPPAVGGWNTSAVTNMNSMFSSCSAMTEPPVVDNWNTSVVTDMSSMFSNCSAMTESPAVGSWNTSAVTIMNSMFRDCPKMTSLDVSSWDFAEVTNSSSYYLGLYNCSALRELKVPAGAKIVGLPEHNAQGAYYATWGNADRGITGSTAADLVTTVNAGNGAGTWKWELDSRAGTAYAVLDSVGTLTFFRSTNTYTAGTNKTVTDIMGNTYTGQVYTGVENTAVGYDSAPWYRQRSSVKLARIADGQIIAPRRCAGWFYWCSNMTAFEGAERLDTSAVTTMFFMFSGCKAMTEPPSVGGWNTSAVTNMYSMFGFCSAMTEPPAVGDWDTGAVTNMSEMFYNCSAMTEPPAVDSWNTSEVTRMDNLFYNCSAMTKPPAVGSWNTSAVTAMYTMFSGCSAMTTPPAVGGWNTSKVTELSYMFSDCSAMTMPPAVGDWDTSVVTDMREMFSGCSAMAESPSVGNWNTSVVTNMSNMFNSCSKIVSLDVSGWNFSNVTSESNYLGLQNCSALKELKVPAGAKITGLPEHSAQGDYAETWGNADRGITGSTAANLVTTVNAGNGAGTWTWDLAGYTVNFMVDGSGTAMQAERVKADEDYVVPSCEVTKLYHDFVEWSGSDGNTYHAGDVVTAGTFAAGETLTLTAVFAPHEYGPGEFDGNLQLSVPASINFVVEPDGTLTGPSNASIVNSSGVNTRVSSIEVKELGNFNFVANAEASGEQNAVELRFGPLSDMLDAASFLSKGGVDDSAWTMGTTVGQNAVQLETEGKVAHVVADITKVNKFGEVRWYVKAGE